MLDTMEVRQETVNVTTRQIFQNGLPIGLYTGTLILADLEWAYFKVAKIARQIFKKMLIDTMMGQ